MKNKSSACQYGFLALRVVALSLSILTLFFDSTSLAADLKGPDSESLDVEILQKINSGSSDFPEVWKIDFAKFTASLLAEGVNLPDFEIRKDHFYRALPLLLARIHAKRELNLYTTAVKVEIQWYMSQLMEGQLPSEETKGAIRRQLEQMFAGFGEVLRIEAPELNPDDLETATQDVLQECNLAIDSAFFPLFRETFTSEQEAQLSSTFSNAVPDFKKRLADFSQKESGRDSGQNDSHRTRGYFLVRETYGPVFTKMKELTAPVPKSVTDAFDRYKYSLQQIDAEFERNKTSDQLVRKYYGTGMTQTEEWGWLLAALLSVGAPEGAVQLQPSE